MKLQVLNIHIVHALVFLFVAKHISGNQQFNAFYYYHSSKSDIPIEIRPANENYVMFMEKSFNKYRGKEIKKLHAQKNIQVNCQLFISSYKQDRGIYTCQDDDGGCYLIPTTGVYRYWYPINLAWTVNCEDPLADIIEGKEMQIACNIKPNSQLPVYEATITIGWIQGLHNITQSYHLQQTALNINHSLFGFNSGEGIFFYCLKTTTICCHTFILNVLPQLNVNIIPLYLNPEIIGQRCFKCQATGEDKKVYTWKFYSSAMTLKDRYKNKICLDNLTTGVYTIECLVITNAQKSSDVTEFKVNIAKDTRTTKQEEKDAEFRKRYKIMVIIPGGTTAILVLIVLFLVYILKKKQRSQSLEAVRYNQRAVGISVGRKFGRSEIDEDDIYYTIEEQSAEPTEHDLVEENFTERKSDRNAEICNREDAESPFYFVLDA